MHQQTNVCQFQVGLCYILVSMYCNVIQKFFLQQNIIYSSNFSPLLHVYSCSKAHLYKLLSLLQCQWLTISLFKILKLIVRYRIILIDFVHGISLSPFKNYYQLPTKLQVKQN